MSGHAHTLAFVEFSSEPPSSGCVFSFGGLYAQGRGAVKGLTKNGWSGWMKCGEESMASIGFQQDLSG